MSSDWFVGGERVQLFELNFISGISPVQYFGDAHSIILQNMYDDPYISFVTILRE